MGYGIRRHRLKAGVVVVKLVVLHKVVVVGAVGGPLLICVDDARHGGMRAVAERASLARAAVAGQPGAVHWVGGRR